MKDKIKIFEYLETLVKMCRSTTDGASLKIEEEDIYNKINDIELDLQELKLSLKEDIYDEAAEMADRNLEIITRKTINTLKSKLKDKEDELSALIKKEQEVSNELTIFKDNRSSYEDYIKVLEGRLNECEDEETKKLYVNNIKNSTEKLKEETEKSELVDVLEEKVESSISLIRKDIDNINHQIDKKQELLDEINNNLQNKESYEDVNKKKRLNKRIEELEAKKKRYEERIQDIKHDPKYMELKIKEIINEGADTFLARDYIIDLINMANRVPYMQMPIDNNLENELLKATKARDTFANEIDHKSYLLVDIENPTKIRIDYLKKRISIWAEQQELIKKQIERIDKDEIYNYHNISKKLNNIINDTKLDISEFNATLESGEEFTPAALANLKASLEEKKNDLENAETIANQFRTEECLEIEKINTSLKDEYQEYEEKIINATQEIDNLNNELLLKRTDLTDIREINKDKRRLKELANIVIDIKHRRNFPLQPNLIAKQLERMLDIELISSLDYTDDEEIVEIEEKESSAELINDLIKKDIEKIDEQYPNIEESLKEEQNKRGLKVTEEIELTEPSLPEEHQEEDLSSPEEELTETELEEIEKDLEKKLAEFKSKKIDNLEEKDDNIITRENNNKLNELEDYIKSLENNE